MQEASLRTLNRTAISNAGGRIRGISRGLFEREREFAPGANVVLPIRAEASLGNDGEIRIVQFPSPEWLEALHTKLNVDNHYGAVARHWEGDLFFDIRPDGRLLETIGMYLDLWHGTCRGVRYGALPQGAPRPKFVLAAKYGNFTAVLLGKLDPMTAMMTNKLKVDGSLGYMMRNVPTVLDFVRCAREITTHVL